MRVIEIITQGPIGPQGPAGPIGSFDTASFVTTASFNQFTSSYNSGSFTGSFFGTASWSNNAITASYVLNAISSSFAQTASLAPNYVLNSATSSFVQNSQTSSFKGFSSATSGSIVTGTNNNTFSKALLIPANSYKTDDIPEVIIRCRRVSGSTANNVYQTRIYWNTTDNIEVNPILIARGPNVIGGNNTLYVARNLSIINATNSTSVNDVTVQTSTDYGVTTLNPQSISIDWTQNGYIVVAIQNVGTTGLNDQNYCDLIRIR